MLLHRSLNVGQFIPPFPIPDPSTVLSGSLACNLQTLYCPNLLLPSHCLDQHLHGKAFSSGPAGYESRAFGFPGVSEFLCTSQISPDPSFESLSLALPPLLTGSNLHILESVQGSILDSFLMYIFPQVTLSLLCLCYYLQPRSPP